MAENAAELEAEEAAEAAAATEAEAATAGDAEPDATDEADDAEETDESVASVVDSRGRRDFAITDRSRRRRLAHDRQQVVVRVGEEGHPQVVRRQPRDDVWGVDKS